MQTPAAEIPLAPRRPLESLPTYALIDVLDCAERDAAGLRRVFDGKTVLVGTTLADEDRKLTSDRFLSRDIPWHSSGTDAPSGCALERLEASDPASVTEPGVHVHAEALRGPASE
jgi:hypothetical protein